MESNYTFLGWFHIGIRLPWQSLWAKRDGWARHLIRRNIDPYFCPISRGRVVFVDFPTSFKLGVNGNQMSLRGRFVILDDRP